MDRIEDYGPYVDEVMELIDDGTSREDIEKELRHNVDYYRLSICDSERRVVRQHKGNADFVICDKRFLDISDIAGDGTYYNIKATVNSVDYETRKGTPVTVGTISDGTGARDFIIWEEVNIERGETYYFMKCQYSEQYSNLKVYSNNIIPLDRKPLEKPDPIKRMIEQSVRLADLDENCNNKTVCARIVDSQTRYKKDGNPFTVLTLEDDSGRRTFSDWDNRDLQIGKRYVFRNISVSVRNGWVNYGFSNRTKIQEVE